MPTVQLGWSRAETLDGSSNAVTEVTGGSAPTDTVEVNIADGTPKNDVLVALQIIRDKVLKSSNFSA